MGRDLQLASLFEHYCNLAKLVAELARISLANFPAASIMVVGKAVVGHSIAEFITYAKDNPGKVYYASPGGGTLSHGGVVQADGSHRLIKHHVSRDGGGGYTDLGITTKDRTQQLPDVPSISEVLPGYEVGVFYGLSASKNTPIGRIGSLNKVINAGLTDPKLWVRLADLGGTLIPGSPANFGKLVADETEKWSGVIRAANIKLQ